MDEETILKKAIDEFIEKIVYDYFYILEQGKDFKEIYNDLERLEEEITKDMNEEQKILLVRFKGAYVDLQVESSKGFLKLGMRLMRF